MKRPPIYVTALIAGAFFMENLDGTIIATALPQMAKSFHVGAVNLNIGMTAYLLTLAVFIPISGWVADRFGARSVFASAIGIFTVSSLLCGFSQTLTQFTLMRILQGLGGAMMVPVGRLIVLRNTPKDQLALAIAYITWPGLTALVLGPPLGGFITTYFSWHWIFFLNLPIGAVALILACSGSKTYAPGEQHPFDWLTFLLRRHCLQRHRLRHGKARRRRRALADSHHHPRRQPGQRTARRRRCAHEADDLIRRPRIAQDQDYALSIYGASAFRIAVSVLPFLLPLMFQIVFGLSAFRSGLYLLALFAGDFSMKASSFRSSAASAFAASSSSTEPSPPYPMVLCATFTPATPPALILLLLFLHGAFRSMEFTCMTTLAYTEIPPNHMSRANGFLSAVMQLSLGMGIAVGAITLRLIAHAHGHSAAAPQLRDFHAAFLLMSILALGPVINAIGLPPDAGATTSGHRQPELEVNPA